MIPIILASFGIGAIAAWFVIQIANARFSRRKKVPSLTKFVVFCITFVVLYTIAEFICAIKFGVSHDVLTGCVYGFFCGEVVMSGLIKIFKLKGDGNNE